MTFQIGASTGCCVEMPIIDVVRALAAIETRGIEIGTPPRHFDVWERSQVMAVKEALRATGIQPIAIHAPFGGLLDLSDPNPHHRNAGIGAIVTAASVLQELGGHVVVVHATDVERKVPDAAQRLQHARESLHTLQLACARMGMVLALETPLPHLIGGSPEEFGRLLDGAGDGICVCLDTGHTTLGHHWDQFSALAEGRLAHVHAHDHGGTYDDHRPPGEGIIAWDRIAQQLSRLGFDRWVMLELRCPTEPLAGYFDRASRRLRELLERQVQVLPSN